MKTVMETFMIGENSRNPSALHASVYELADSPKEAFGRWMCS
jgi:hypothetical protein